MSTPTKLRAGTPLRTLPNVLRASLSDRDAVRFQLGKAISSPDPTHIVVEIGGVELTVPKLNGYVPSYGDPVYILTSGFWTLAIGTVSWTEAVPTQGPPGPDGPQGPQGPQGDVGPAGPAGPAGPQGTPGEAWYTGTGPPLDTTGVVGDWYLDSASGTFYERVPGPQGGEWISRGSLKGPTGATGAAGAPGTKWFSAASSTPPTASNFGDFWLASDTGNYSEWVNMFTPPSTFVPSWVPRGSLKGPTGAQGPAGSTGSQGPAGTSGEKWFTGAGAPAGTLAGSVVGDWYLDSATGDYYEKTGASAWTLRGNLKGPPGSKWFSASGIPSGGVPALAVVGDFYLDGNTGIYYEKTTTTTWTNRGSLIGPQGSPGAPGAAGTPGEKWSSGAGAPSTGIGAVGDWYLDSTTGDYYEKTVAVVWSLRGNLKGATGATGSQGPTGATGSAGAPGAAGARGSLWYVSDASHPDPPNVTSPQVGDQFLYGNSGDVFTYTGTGPMSGWAYAGNIKGATGAAGPQGPKGDKGDTGAQGPSGAAESQVGDTTAEAAPDDLNPDAKLVARYTVPAGSITKGSVYLDGNGPGSGNVNTRFVVYADSAGAPGALLGSSDTVVVTDGQPAGWVSYPFSTPVVLATTSPVWIGLHIATNATVNVYRKAGGSTVYQNPSADAFTDGASNPYGTTAPGSPIAFTYSVYATVQLKTGDLSSTLVDAKGDLIVATANDTVTRKPAGVDNAVLTSDAAQADGLKWVKVGDAMILAGSNLAKLATVTGTPDGTKFLRDDGSWQTPPGAGGALAFGSSTLGSDLALSTSLGDFAAVNVPAGTYLVEAQIAFYRTGSGSPKATAVLRSGPSLTIFTSAETDTLPQNTLVTTLTLVGICTLAATDWIRLSALVNTTAGSPFAAATTKGLPQGTNATRLWYVKVA